MSLELNLRFPDPGHVVVRYDDRDTEALEFVSPLDEKALEDIRWYLEVYAARYTTDVDDEAARRIEAKLPQWGEALFEAAFNSRAAERIFNDFQENDEPGRLLTISANLPLILSLPWELLKDPEGAFLFHEDPRISIRRKLAGGGGGRKFARIEPKEGLRLLFVVSRPTDANFIDPRSDPLAVLQAIEQEAAAQVEVEFLRPATLDTLVERLEDRRLAAVDIIHFDGHGTFDHDGRLHEQALKSDPLVAVRDSGKSAENTGYLLFEDAEGKESLISAETLGDMLHRKKVGLMVLSACQSAKVSGDEAMSSVAARLTDAGIPAVLAMTHSVLVSTTRDLFAQFYKHLIKGCAVGEALDNARRHLYLHQERGERQRGDSRITLKLQDWFLPALYQAGKDVPLLTPHPDPLPKGARGLTPHPNPLPKVARGSSPSLSRERAGVRVNNLPELQEAGFFGRSRELWFIEREFVKGARRFTISGFGGQGKTYLAIEAGNWLQRTGMFEKVCFVDYAAFQGVDAVGLAVSTLGTVLNKSLLDANAATQALQETPILLILDNLETLDRGHPVRSDALDRGHPVRSLQDLLTAAKAWSEAENSRILLTTRMADLQHPGYPKTNSLIHQSLPLKGLGHEDALSYFQSLMKLPPAPLFELPQRKALLELFKMVDFHPLSIGLLAQQLKTRRPAELGERLETLLTETPDNPLLASLNLSLDRLPEEAKRWLPRLGVFQGGAFEDDLQAITEFSEEQWRSLRSDLETTGLLRAEALPGVRVPFLKFHPTLAPALWSKLSQEEQEELLARHRQCYYQLSGYLYSEDRQNPHQARATALRELPNLLFAVHEALEAGEEAAVEFVDNVNRFLDFFGLQRDHAELTRRAQALAGEVGSQAWLLSRSNQGEQLYNAGRYQEAAQVFEEILAELGKQPSFNRCQILVDLGRCFGRSGLTEQAASTFRQGIEEAKQLEATDSVKQKIGHLQSDLATVLRDMGRFAEAREAYEATLAIDEELGDLRSTAVDNGRLGTLAMLEGDLQEAEERHQDALKTFQALNEPEAEASAWHQLGYVYDEARQWEAAEQAYREAANIKEKQGNLAGAARTWNNLAIVTKNAGKPQEAEGWYRKAIEGFEIAGNKAMAYRAIQNLADLLQNQPECLNEARQLAEEALAIKQTLDPGVSTIWTTYDILAQIADKQQEPERAREYRRQARQAKANFAGTEHELRKYAELIGAVVAAVQGEIEALAVVKQEQDAMRQSSEDWEDLADAIDRLLAGERDEDVLCESFEWGVRAMIVLAILRQL